QVLLRGNDLGAPLVGLRVDLLDLLELLLDDTVDASRVTEDAAKLCDAFPEILVLLLDLLAREAGQPREAEVEDRLRLDLRELELALQALARSVCVCGVSDQRNDGVEVV